MPRRDPGDARARPRPDRHHRQRRLVLPRATETAYTASKAAVHRYAETLANELAGRIPVLAISPGPVRTEMTEGRSPTTRPGRYLHAEHDDPDDLAARAIEILERDLNAIRLRR